MVKVKTSQNGLKRVLRGLVLYWAFMRRIPQGLLLVYNVRQRNNRYGTARCDVGKLDLVEVFTSLCIIAFDDGCRDSASVTAFYGDFKCYCFVQGFKGHGDSFPVLRLYQKILGIVLGIVLGILRKWLYTLISPYYYTNYTKKNKNNII